jgi:hypothetical protein
MTDQQVLEPEVIRTAPPVPCLSRQPCTATVLPKADCQRRPTSPDYTRNEHARRWLCSTARASHSHRLSCDACAVVVNSRNHHGAFQ